MQEQLIKSEEKFIFRFEGGNTVDAAVLASTISDVANLVKLAAKRIDNSAYLKINVTAFKEGCFQIDFSAISEIINNLATDPNAGTIAMASIVAVFGFFEIKKFLKGEKPAEIRKVKNKNKAKIIKNNGECIEVNEHSTSIFKDCNIDNLTIHIAENAKENGGNGFSIIADEIGADRIEFNGEDVKNLAKPCIHDTEEEVLQKVSRMNALLAIKKPDILGYSKWTFRLDGKDVDVSIRDLDWLDKVHEGKIAISAGDSINVVLETTIELDENKEPVEGSARYAILNVNGSIIHKGTQIEIGGL